MTTDLELSKPGGNPPTASPEVDFSIVLARVIASIQNDPAQLRNTVYELARVKLRREAWQRHPSMDVREIGRMMRALETAIERVEVVSSRYDGPHVVQSLDRLLEPQRGEPLPFGALEHGPAWLIDQTPATAHRSLALAPAQDASAPARMRPGRSSRGMRLLAGCTAAALALVLYVAFGRYPALLDPSRLAPSKDATSPPSAADVAAGWQSQPASGALQAPTLPVPTVYGIYAVADDQLKELEPLPGRVPDKRVFMSTAVKTPSRMILPTGRLAFVIYRRDIAANAPQRVDVRVIAKITRAMTFNAGSANVAAVQDEWTIRGNSYELRVAPVTGNPEMLLVRPESSDFSFPSGRYGLVVRGQAYDFTVAGAITDPAQCLERTEAANGTFYSECRSP